MEKQLIAGENERHQWRVSETRHIIEGGKESETDVRERGQTVIAGE